MGRSPLVYVAVGAVLMFAYLRWRGVVVGLPWNATPAKMGPRSTAA